MRRLAAVVAALTAVSVAVLPALPAAATLTALPFTHYTDMVVDEAHGHLFFSPGSGGSVVYVTDLAGQSVTSLSSLAGATGLAMSPDGATVYVAASAAGSISAIDTTTLAVSSVATGLSCPTWLAYAGGKLWFSSGCTANSGTFAGFDPTGTPITTTPAPGGTTFYYAPHLSGGAGTLVATGSTEPASQVSYDVSGDGPTQLAANSSLCQGAFGSVAVSPDGAHVAVACGYPYQVAMAKTSDFSVENYYSPASSSPYPDAAAFSPDGKFLATGFSQYNPNVAVFAVDHPTAPAYSAYLQDGGQGFLPADGLRVGATGTLYAVIPTSVYENAFVLDVVADATKFSSTVTMSGPATAVRAQPLSITGTLTGADGTTPAGAELAVERIDLSGTRQLAPVVTAADGTFTIHDSPGVGGAVTYRATWAGDDTHRGSTAQRAVTVSRTATSLTVSSTATTIGYAGKVTITAHLGKTYNSRVVTITETPYGMAKKTVVSRAVDSYGNLRVTMTLYRRTTFAASFAGDYRYAPVTVSKAVAVRGKLTEALGGAYSRSGSYALYHHTTNPLLAAQLSPAQSGVCLYFRAEAYYSGAWHLIASSGCLTTNSYGVTGAYLYNSHVVGAPYRMRASWLGNKMSAAVTGSWQYFKFT